MSSKIRLVGLDGSNPLAFLAALGTLRSTRQIHHGGDVTLSWSLHDGLYRPILEFPGHVTEDEFVESLFKHLALHPETHPIAFVQGLHGTDLATVHNLLLGAADRPCTSITALEFLAVLISDASSDPAATSQIQIVRRDYFWGNIKSIITLTTAPHLRRTLFQPWDYADPLNNQSLHLDPSEDRRYANQWHQPTKDPTRATRGGMLGANRLAIEALPFFPALGKGKKLRTLGFEGTRADSTRWTWPIWEAPLTTDAIASVLGLTEIQADELNAAALRLRGIVAAFRTRRILVEKTPNLTPPIRV